MDPDAARSGDDAEAYWRRRAAILAAGLLALGLVAWALSGSGGPGPRPGPGPGLAQERANRLPPAAYGSDPAGSPSPLMPTDTPLASGSPRPSASPSGGARKRTAARASHPGSRAGGSCQPASVVVTLFMSKPSYGPRDEPAFNVYAVSTAASPCTFPFGGRAVRVLVLAHGRTVWNSAACPAAPPRTLKLIRGVPEQLSVNWNRRVPHPRACRGRLPRGAHGKMTAVARAGGQTSPPVFFDLVP